MQLIIRIILIVILSISISSADEIFVSLKKNKVNVRYGPSFDSDVKYVYKKINLPLKQIDKKENFRRIIDFKNNGGWIHISQLKKSKSLIATSEKILFRKPTKYSEPVAKLEAGRLLVVKKCKKKWCNVSTGQYSGWVDKIDTWGTE